MQRLFYGIVTAAACALASFAARADFVFTGFTPSDASLNLVGSPNAPTVVGTNLQLTTNATNQSGAAWYNTKQSIAAGFSSTFTFQVSNQTAIPFAVPSDNGADGVTFVIQNVNNSQVGGPGQGIGYSGISNSLAVEADTFFNTNITVFGNPIASSNGDPNGNHISIQTNGLNPNSDNITASKGFTTTIPNLSDGAAHTVKISYTPGTMNVFVDDLNTVALTVPVDLSTLLSLDAGTAFVGLTSGTGQATETHQVSAWSFTAVPEPASLGLISLAAGLALRRRRRPAR